MSLHVQIKQKSTQEFRLTLGKVQKTNSIDVQTSFFINPILRILHYTYRSLITRTIHEQQVKLSRRQSYYNIQIRPPFAFHYRGAYTTLTIQQRAPRRLTDGSESPLLRGTNPFDKSPERTPTYYQLPTLLRGSNGLSRECVRVIKSGAFAVAIKEVIKPAGFMTRPILIIAKARRRQINEKTRIIQWWSSTYNLAVRK